MKKVIQIFLPLACIALATLPAILFFSVRAGIDFFPAAAGGTYLDRNSFIEASGLLFPLVGLYAFFFVYLQIMIGSNMRWLRSLYPWIESYHRKEGIVTLLFALAHPTLLALNLGVAQYLHFDFVQPSLVPFVFIGEAQLFLMLCTVAAGLLRNTKLLQRHWIYIHYANYLVFILIWVHSWFLGSDVQSTPLRYLWIWYAVSVGISFIARLLNTGKMPQRPVEATAGN